MAKRIMQRIMLSFTDHVKHSVSYTYFIAQSRRTVQKKKKKNLTTILKRNTNFIFTKKNLDNRD